MLSVGSLVGHVRNHASFSQRKGCGNSCCVQLDSGSNCLFHLAQSLQFNHSHRNLLALLYSLPCFLAVRLVSPSWDEGPDSGRNRPKLSQQHEPLIASPQGKETLPPKFGQVNKQNQWTPRLVNNNQPPAKPLLFIFFSKMKGNKIHPAEFWSPEERKICFNVNLISFWLKVIGGAEKSAKLSLNGSIYR